MCSRSQISSWFTRLGGVRVHNLERLWDTWSAMVILRLRCGLVVVGLDSTGRVLLLNNLLHHDAVVVAVMTSVVMWSRRHHCCFQSRFRWATVLDDPSRIHNTLHHGLEGLSPLLVMLVERLVTQLLLELAATWGHIERIYHSCATGLICARGWVQKHLTQLSLLVLKLRKTGHHLVVLCIV